MECVNSIREKGCSEPFKFKSVEIHLIPMDPVALTLKVEQKVALTGLAGLAR